MPIKHCVAYGLHTQVSLQGYRLAVGLAEFTHNDKLNIVLWWRKGTKSLLAILNCCLHQCLRNSKTSNLPEWLPMFDPRKAVIHSTMRSYLFSFLCFWWLTASQLQQMFQGSKVYLMRLLPHGCSSAPSRTRSLLLQPLFFAANIVKLGATAHFCRWTKFFLCLFFFFWK